MKARYWLSWRILYCGSPYLKATGTVWGMTTKLTTIELSTTALHVRYYFCFVKSRASKETYEPFNGCNIHLSLLLWTWCFVRRNERMCFVGKYNVLCQKVQHVLLPGLELTIPRSRVSCSHHDYSIPYPRTEILLNRMQPPRSWESSIILFHLKICNNSHCCPGICLDLTGCYIKVICSLHRVSQKKSTV